MVSFILPVMIQSTELTVQKKILQPPPPPTNPTSTLWQWQNPKNDRGSHFAKEKLQCSQVINLW